MEHDDGMKDTRESTMSEEKSQTTHEAQMVPPIVLDPDRRVGRGPIIGSVLAALLLGVFLVVGIRSRVHAKETLAESTKQDSVLAVAVTTPSHGADALEITLPANTQAHIDTPIYARTNGYMRRWYADIGTRVHSGQVLAEIETPELDQAKTQLDQARVQRTDLEVQRTQYEHAIAVLIGKPPDRHRAVRLLPHTFSECYRRFSGNFSIKLVQLAEPFLGRGPRLIADHLRRWPSPLRKEHNGSPVRRHRGQLPADSAHRVSTGRGQPSGSTCSRKRSSATA